jgi:hypothetical protein
VDDLRAILGVKNGRLTRVPNLLQRVIERAVLEVNGLADFGVAIVAYSEGRPATRAGDWLQDSLAEKTRMR